jgi:uncharacterized RDD family membrane protein YckC
LESSSSSSPSAAPGPGLAPDYVGFSKRCVAFLIDIFILLVIAVPLLMAIYGRAYFDPAREGLAGFWDLVINVLAPAAATLLFWRYRGATPGKMAIGAKVVDAKTGGAPSTGSLVARYFGYIASALPLMLGFAWIAVDRRKQGFHDKIAGTVVIYDEE